MGYLFIVILLQDGAVVSFFGVLSASHYYPLKQTRFLSCTPFLIYYVLLKKKKKCVFVCVCWVSCHLRACVAARCCAFFEQIGVENDFNV